MSRFYSNENLPLEIVKSLRKFGHDVLTSVEAGQANQGIPDNEVLTYAASENRILITLNREDFNKRPRRKQRGIATLFLTFHAPQGAGNLPVILLNFIVVELIIMELLFVKMIEIILVKLKPFKITYKNKH